MQDPAITGKSATPPSQKHAEFARIKSIAGERSGVRKQRGRCIESAVATPRPEKPIDGKRWLLAFEGPCEQRNLRNFPFGQAFLYATAGVSQTWRPQFRVYFWLFYLLVVHAIDTTWKLVVLVLFCVLMVRTRFKLIYTWANINA
jgi:hypothetical protein